MPKLADKDMIERAYQLWARGVSIPDIVDRVPDTTIVQIEGWRSKHGWTKRRKLEEVEAQGNAVSKANIDLFQKAPDLLEAALDLAFNAESESVRATQVRYLLGSLGISPDTATERVRQLAMNVEQVRKLAEEPIRDVKDAIDVIEAKTGDWDG